MFNPKQACYAGCAQTLTDANATMGKILLFSKIDVNSEQMMQF